MYKTYGQLYRKQELLRFPKENQNYLSDLQPCNKNIPVGSICCHNYMNCTCSNNSTNTTKCLSCDYQRFDQPCAANSNYYPAQAFPNPLAYNNMNVNRYQIETQPFIDLYNPKFILKNIDLE
jgi:hypothetical protein